MNAEGPLQTLAEVSIALAGFGSLLVVLRRSPAYEWSEGEAVDLLIVVGGSLLVLFFSLLPMAIARLGPSPAGAWRLSGVLFGLVLIASYTVVLTRRSRLLRAGQRPSFPRLARVVAQLPLLLIGVLALSAVGVLPGAGAYLLVLLLLLAGSAYPLVTLVLRVGSG